MFENPSDLSHVRLPLGISRRVSEMNFQTLRPFCPSHTIKNHLFGGFGEEKGLSEIMRGEGIVEDIYIVGEKK